MARIEDENLGKGVEHIPHVWDKFSGRNVALQLRIPYLTVTSPGVFIPIQVEEGQGFLKMPVLTGACEIVKDPRGNVRVRMTFKDPHKDKHTMVVSDFSPEDISVISFAETESLITPG
jgi:hypothetical protein